MTSRRVLPVMSAQVGHVWGAVEPFVSRAIVRSDGGYASVDVLARLRDQRMQLWTGYADGRLEAAAITEIVVRPRKKVLRIVAMAGRDAPAWIETGMPMLEAFGRESGCKDIEMQGRRGWERLLGSWRADHIVMRKGL